LRKYLDAWVKHIENPPEKPFNWHNYSSSLSKFFSSFDEKKYYKEVSKEKKEATIFVQPNNSTITIRRIGDILAFNIPTSSGKDHASGIRAIESLCRADDPCNNQGVYELVQNIKISFLLPKKQTENGGMEREIDFSDINQLLEKTMSGVNWQIDSSAIISSYLEIDEDGTKIGDYFGLQVSGSLNHGKTEEKNDITNEGYCYKSRAKTWRKGNIEKINETRYCFAEGENLYFTLTIKSSLPYSQFEDTDISLKAHREQFILANAGAIMYTQLCSMMLDEDQKQSIKNGN